MSAAGFDRQHQLVEPPPQLLLVHKVPPPASHFHHLQQQIPYQLQHQQLLYLHSPEQQQRRLEFERSLKRLDPTYTSTPSLAKCLPPLHVDCSVEYELPSQAKPPPGAQGEPLLMIHPSYYRRAERERRTTFVNNLPTPSTTVQPTATSTSLRTGKAAAVRRKPSSVQPPLPTAAKAPSLDEVVLKSCGYPSYFQAQKHTATTPTSLLRQQQQLPNLHHPALHPYKRSAATATSTAVRPTTAKPSTASSSLSSTPVTYNLYPQQQQRLPQHHQQQAFHPHPHHHQQQLQQQQFLHALQQQQQQRPSAAATTSTPTTTSLITANPAAFFEPPPPLYPHHHHHHHLHHHHALLPQS